MALLDNLGFRLLKVRSHVTSAFMSTSTLHQTLTHYGNKSNGDANCVFSPWALMFNFNVDGNANGTCEWTLRRCFDCSGIWEQTAQNYKL